MGYLTRLGDDEFGESFLKLWRREGIDTRRIVKDPDAFTAAYFIFRKGGQHYFTYFRRDSAASRMTPGFLPKDYIAGAKLLARLGHQPGHQPKRLRHGLCRHGRGQGRRAPGFLLPQLPALGYGPWTGPGCRRGLSELCLKMPS